MYVDPTQRRPIYMGHGWVKWAAHPCRRLESMIYKESTTGGGSNRPTGSSIEPAPPGGAGRRGGALSRSDQKIEFFSQSPYIYHRGEGEGGRGGGQGGRGEEEGGRGSVVAPRVAPVAPKRSVLRPRSFVAHLLHCSSHSNASPRSHSPCETFSHIRPFVRPVPPLETPPVY